MWPQARCLRKWGLIPGKCIFGSGAHQTSYSMGGRSFHMGKAAWAWSCPLIFILFPGYEKAGLHIHSSYIPSWHALAQLYLSQTIFSHKYFCTVHTTGRVSGVTVVTQNCRICVFFIFHFNTTITDAHSLVEAAVLLTKCGTCLIHIRCNFISKCFRWNHSFSICHFLAHLCHLYTDKKYEGRGVTHV